MISSLRGACLLLVSLLVSAGCAPGEEDATAEATPFPPTFTRVQPDLFDAAGAQPNAWADYDLDGDLDLFVGFRDGADRLYRNDEGSFTEVASEAGLADGSDTRAAAWGDWDGDGDPDLFVGYGGEDGPNALYRNEGGGSFVDVAQAVGIARTGVTRQPAFVDYDGDGDLDLYDSFRDGPNALFRNDGGSFVDVAEEAGVDDARRSVGATWFDMDGDGDLDLFVANQEGDEDGVYRNRGDGGFSSVAAELGMSRAGRSETEGSVGTAVADYDNDGDLDLFVASYGPDVLWQNQGDGTFVDVAGGTPLAADRHSVAAAWGDFDNDGRVDLYVNTFVSDEPEAPDALLRNTGGGFEVVTPAELLEHGSSHGVAWADFDIDGDLDLALANNHPEGGHPLWVNGLPPRLALQSMQVAAVNREGVWNRPGTTITVRRESDGFVSSRVMDAGGGYASQGVTPVHFGLPPGVGAVSLTIVWYERGERRSSTISGIDPGAFRSQWIVLQLGVE